MRLVVGKKQMVVKPNYNGMYSFGCCVMWQILDYVDKNTKWVNREEFIKGEHGAMYAV